MFWWQIQANMMKKIRVGIWGKLITTPIQQRKVRVMVF